MKRNAIITLAYLLTISVVVNLGLLHRLVTRPTEPQRTLQQDKENTDRAFKELEQWK